MMQPKKRNAKEQKIYDLWRGELQAYLLTCKCGMEVRALEREIVELMGKEVDYVGMGVDSWTSFLFECSDVIEVYVDDRSNLRKKFIFARLDRLPEEAAHIGELVKRQEKGGGKRKIAKDGSILNPTRAQVRRVDPRELLKGPYIPPAVFNPSFNKGQYARNQRVKEKYGTTSTRGFKSSRPNGSNYTNGYGGGSNGASFSRSGGSSSYNGYGGGGGSSYQYGQTTKKPAVRGSYSTPRIPAVVRHMVEDDENDFYDEDGNAFGDCDYVSGGPATKSCAKFPDLISTPITEPEAESAPKKSKAPDLNRYVIPQNRPNFNQNGQSRVIKIVPGGAEDDSDSDTDYVGEVDENQRVENVSVSRNSMISRGSPVKVKDWAVSGKTNIEITMNHQAASVESVPSPTLIQPITLTNDGNASATGKFSDWIDGLDSIENSPLGLSPRPHLVPRHGELMVIVALKPKHNQNKDNKVVFRLEYETPIFEEMEAEMNDFYKSPESQVMMVKSTIVKGFYVGYWELAKTWTRVEVRKLPDVNDQHLNVYAYDYAENITIDLSRGHLRYMSKKLKSVPKSAYLGEFRRPGGLAMDCESGYEYCKSGALVVCYDSLWCPQYRIPLVRGEVHPIETLHDPTYMESTINEFISSCTGDQY